MTKEFMSALFDRLSKSAAATANDLQGAIDGAAMASLLNTKGPSAEAGSRFKRSRDTALAAGDRILANGDGLERVFPDRDPHGNISGILANAAGALNALRSAITALDTYADDVTKRVLTQGEQESIARELQGMAAVRNFLIALSTGYAEMSGQCKDSRR